MSEQAIRLTQYSHGAGCGCKISPKVLETILHSEQAKFVDQTCLSATKPAMMPPFTISVMAPRSSAPPISLCRLSITRSTLAASPPPTPSAIFSLWAGNRLWRLPSSAGRSTPAPEIAREVVEGGRFACQQAGIALAGGHSIDAPEPIFGLAVTGVVPTERIKKNSTAQAGCKLYLTKPLGIGVLTTAEKNRCSSQSIKG